jgi:hypothetical protein
MASWYAGWKRLGVAKVTVPAAGDLGGYAWARYGAVPEDWDALRKTLSVRALEMSTQLDPKTALAVNQLLGSKDPRALWVLSDMKGVGEKLLTGTQWNAVLSLSDADAMDRFRLFMGITQKANPYHDAQGRFTTRDRAAVGAREEAGSQGGPAGSRRVTTGDGEAHDAAANKVLSYKDSAHREYGVGIDKHGRQVCQAKGDEHSVSLPQYGSPASDSLKGGTFYHNHPSGTGLSIADVTVAAWYDCEIRAVTMEGSVYAARARALGPSETRKLGALIKEARDIAIEKTRSLTDEVAGAMEEWEKRPYFEAVNDAMAHLSASALGEAGLIKYRAKLFGRAARAWDLMSDTIPVDKVRAAVKAHLKRRATADKSLQALWLLPFDNS